MKKGIKLIDNTSAEYMLGDVLREMLSENQFTEISIATGYWDLPGMVSIFEPLKGFLERGHTKIRLLLGEEPSVKAYQLKNPQKQDADFPYKYIKRDLEELHLQDDFQNVIALMCRFMKQDTSSGLEVRLYRKQFLHAKCYIFGRENENAVGIIGSSNFTKQGLYGNLELNQMEDNNATVNFVRKSLQQHPSHRSWFEDLWAQSEDWTGLFREEVLSLSKHGEMCYSPYEMYIHALYRIYGQDLLDEKEEKIDSDDPSSGKPELLKFQVQNANSLIKKLERQGVAMLSDSVGLGKTYTAIKVIEHYFKHHNQRVVIICPSGLIPQWERTFTEFKIENPPRIYSLQDVNKINQIRDDLKDIPVGLFVFDESHNLRSSGGQRFEVFIKWKQENPKAKTLLLTATPINNQLRDLTNQIMLASGGEIHELGRFYDRNRQKYFTIKERLELLQADIKKQITETGVVDYKQMKEQLTPLLNRFIVRRTRQGIEKEYPDGLMINGKLQKFPVSWPCNLVYQVPNQFRSDLLKMTAGMPLLKEALSYEIESLTTLDFLAHPLDLFEYYEKRETPVISSLEIIYTAILSLGFPCYRYNIYRYAYYGRKRGTLELNSEDNRELSRQIGIYGIFRTVFLKRLESSMYAISKSVLSYEEKLRNFKLKLEKFNKIISIKNMAALDKMLASYNEQSLTDDELDTCIETFEKETEDFVTIEASEGTFYVEKLKEDIEKDLQIIKILKEQLHFLTDKDDKIQVLAKHLNQNSDRKVLIFTYFADTLGYLSEQLPQYLVHNKNIEFALGNKKEIEDYAKRFAPVSKRYELKPGEKEIDFLIATDKLSEGQNLQDSGMIVNYDLHWNPVRMIQRNGRINRLGTLHEEIFIYNFRPVEQLESYLRLVSKLQEKINLIRYTVGSDQSVLDEEPIPQDFTEDLYSHDEKKRQEAYQKIFETSELLAAEDLFMDDLRAFDASEQWDQSYKEKIKNIPKGKWGKLQKEKAMDNFTHLLHILDGNDDAGYFIAFKNNTGDMLSTAEGLLYIQAISTANERYRDTFMNKAQTEEAIRNYIDSYQFREGSGNNDYSNTYKATINDVFRTMFEYQYPYEKIKQLEDFLSFSLNTYHNIERDKLLREARKMKKNKDYISSEMIEKFIELSSSYKHSEGGEKSPIKEIIQIFE